MEKLTGIVIFKVNSASIRATKCTLKIGGKRRTPVVADAEIQGYFETPVPAEITVGAVHGASSDLIAVRDMVDGEGTFICDSGPAYAITGLTCQDPPEIAGGEGMYNVNYFGKAARKANA